MFLFKHPKHSGFELFSQFIPVLELIFYKVASWVLLKIIFSQIFCAKKNSHNANILKFVMEMTLENKL